MERTKRYFDGTGVTGKKISELLPEILGGLAPKGTDEREALWRLWMDLLGEKMGTLTQIVSWKNRVLTIKVKSATLYALLAQREKGRLLQEIQKKFAVQELVFRVG